jgi:glycosyltransferase involved in cell wall biosynthesis
MTNGLHARVAESLRFMVESFDQVIIYSFRDHASDPWTPEDIAKLKEMFPSIRLVLDDGRRARIATRFKNVGLKLLPQFAQTFLRWHMPSATPNYDALLKNVPDSTFWFINFTNGLSQLNGLPPGTLIVDTIDVKFINHSRKHGQRPNSLGSLLRLRGEMAALETSDAVIAISPPESGFFKTVLSSPRIFYLPTFLPAARQIDTAPAEPFLYDLLFVGALNEFNIQGILRFFNTIEPQLGQLRIGIAGKICESDQIQSALRDKTNVSLLGYIPDLTDLYRKSKACLSPTEGTGVKMKILSAIAHGKPVFGSQHSIDCLPAGFQDCIFPLHAPKILEIINNRALLAHASAAAIKYAATLGSAGDQESFAEYIGITAEIRATRGKQIKDLVGAGTP